MTRDNEPAIEVEVVEIDGSAPPPPREPGDALAGRDDDDGYRSDNTRATWQRWPGQPRMIHPLWWPFIIVGGGIMLAIILTIGMAVAVLLLIYRIVRGLLRALFG